MRKLITIILVLAASVAFGQTTYQLNYDSIRVGKTAGNGATSLYGKTYLKNATEGTPSDSVLTVRNGRVYKIAGSAISSVGFLTYVFSRTASDISGYEQMPALTSYTIGAADTATVAATTTPAIIQEFATNTGFPNTTLIPAGVFNVTYQTQKNSGSQSYYTYAVIYKRNLAGTETAIATTNNSSSVSANTVQSVSVSAVSPTDISVLTTDRIVVKVFAVMVSGTANISIYYDDATDSRLAFPSALVDATNFVPYNGGVKDLDLGAFNLQADTVKGTAAIFNSSSKTLQVQFSGANVLSVNSTLAGASAPGGVYANSFTAGSTRLADLSVTNLNSGGLVKAGNTSGLFSIAVSGTDYLAPGTAVLLTGNQSIAGNKTFTDDVNITGTDGTPSLTVTASGSVSRAISASTSGSSSIAIIADGTSGASGVVASAGNGAYGVQGNNTGSGWGGGFTSVSGPAIAAVSTSGVGGAFQSGSANIAEFYGSGTTLNAKVAQSGSISSTPQGTLYGTASGSITSAQLATSLSDETGTGNAVFSASPTFTGTIAAAAAGFTGAVNLATSSGNVGIGTTSPDASDWNASARLLHIYQNTTNGSVIKLESSNASGIVGVGNNAMQLGTITDDPLLFYTNITERMRITTGGNVLIGTSTDAGYKLDVNGTGRFSGALSGTSATFSGLVDVSKSGQAIRILAITTDATYQQIQNTTGNMIVGNESSVGGSVFTGTSAYAGIIGTASTRDMCFGTNSTERMRITSGGEVYIAGTTDQGAYNLQVNGTGVWGAGAYVNGSDLRLKEDIKPILSGLDYVNKMNPVSFKYLESYSKDRSIQTGFIAQELQEVFKDEEWVEGIVKKGTEHYNVAYQNIIPILVKSIQELSARIIKLESK